jgi:transcriptional regulator with XRE-family HTH domain
MGNSTLGVRIRGIRKGLKLNQIDFARELGFKSATAVSKYEDNSRTPGKNKLIKIAEMGNITLDALLMDVESDSPNSNIINSYPPAAAQTENSEHIKISEDLFLATRVLESGTTYATALHLNIRSFAKAIDAEERITVLESNQRDFERKMQAEMNDLRKEVNRLKATYEGPDGGVGHLTDTEKQAM